MNFSTLSQYLEKTEKTASRNEMTEILAEVFKKTPASEIDKICYLSLGKLAPKYQGIEFNIAEKMMVRALAIAFNKDLKATLKIYKDTGDLGEVALKLKIQNEKFKIEISN